MSRILKFLFVSLFTLTAVGCGDLRTESCPAEDGVRCQSVMIDAAFGGTLALSLPNGSGELVVPPGALSEDTLISAYTPEEATPGRTFIDFAPDGLTFNKPVTLTIPGPSTTGTVPPLMQWYHLSDLNPVVDVGSEQHNWQPMDNATWNEAAGTVSAEMSHFSSGFFYWGVDDYGYLVVDIPGKYLRPGDVVVVMTGMRNWVPGHAALVRTATASGATVIESTVGGGPAGNVNGVQTGNTLPNFKVEAGHIYMGASRPPGDPMTDTERRAITKFADSQLGARYNVWGSPSRGGFGNGWSCSGFVEASLDAGGRGVRGAFSFHPSPIEMYEDTRQVNEIDVRIGDTIEIPVYPVAIAPGAAKWGFSDNAWYDVGVANNPAAVVTTVGALPTGATFATDAAHRYGAHTLKWTPTKDQMGTTHVVTFNLKGSTTLTNGDVIPYDVTKTLTINILGDAIAFPVTPASMGTSGTYYFKFWKMPADRTNVIMENEGRLVDLATDAFPTNPVFPLQDIDEIKFRWSTTQTDYYGCEMHIARNEPPYNPAPTGLKNFVCYLDWYYDRYDGTN